MRTEPFISEVEVNLMNQVHLQLQKECHPSKFFLTLYRSYLSHFSNEEFEDEDFEDETDEESEDEEFEDESEDETDEESEREFEMSD